MFLTSCKLYIRVFFILLFDLPNIACSRLYTHGEDVSRAETAVSETTAAFYDTVLVEVCLGSR